MTNAEFVVMFFGKSKIGYGAAVIRDHNGEMLYGFKCKSETNWESHSKVFLKLVEILKSAGVKHVMFLSPNRMLVNQILQLNKTAGKMFVKTRGKNKIKHSEIWEMSWDILKNMTYEAMAVNGDITTENKLIMVITDMMMSVVSNNENIYQTIEC